MRKEIIGIMQGRLSHQNSNNLQIFPWQTWEIEFDRARSIGLDCIEWLFDVDNFSNNPIWTISGRQQIHKIVRETKVKVLSVCAHYFIRGGLVWEDQGIRSKSVDVLNNLIRYSASLGIKQIVIPFMENASILSRPRRLAAIKSLRECLPIAIENGVLLAVETDLPCSDLIEFMQCLKNLNIRVCYDIGNAVAMGYTVTGDIRYLMPWIAEIHVKDRSQDGKNVLLGSGDVDFETFFREITELGYTGPYVMETPSGDNWEENAEQHLQFVLLHLSQASEHIIV